MGDIGAIIQPAATPAVAALSCANCHAPLTGPFCAACGQKRESGHRSVGHLLRALVEDMISFDSRILRTARALMLRPGELTRAFHEGRTQPYVPAVRLYLFVSLLFFLILSVTGLAPMQFAAERGAAGIEPTILFFAPLQPPSAVAPLKNLGKELQSEGIDVGAGSVVGQGMADITQKLFANPAALNATMTEWIPRVLFGLLPLFALLLQLVYWSQRRTFYFVDHLVFSLNLHSFGFALLLLGALAAQVLPAVPLLVVAALALHMFLAMRVVYRQGWLATGVKFAAVGGVYVLFFLMPAFIGIILMAMFGAPGLPSA
jgi:hypothetical protein